MGIKKQIANIEAKETDLVNDMVNFIQNECHKSVNEMFTKYDNNMKLLIGQISGITKNPDAIEAKIMFDHILRYKDLNIKFNKFIIEFMDVSLKITQGNKKDIESKIK